jgi:O-antigen ligase
MKKKLKYKERRQLQNQKNNNIIAGAASVFFIIITAFYPLYIGLTKYLWLTTDKTYFFWAVTVIAAATLLILLLGIKQSIIIKNYYMDNEPPRPVSVAEWALLVFVAWTFLSAFLSSWLNGYENKDGGSVVWLGAADRYEGFLSFLCYALCFIITARFYKPKRLHFLLIAGSASLVSLYGLLQFAGVDLFNLFPFDGILDEYGYPLYGPLSAFFKTTLGNVNIVSAYCTFAVILCTALYAVSRSRWQYLYLGGGAASFALFLLTGENGEAGLVAIFGAMVLLVPYWLSDRERISKILIMLSGWCVAYAGHSAYLSALKRKYEAEPFDFAPHDQHFLNAYPDKNITAFLIIAGVLLAGGLLMLLILKKWNARVLKTAGIIFLPVMIIGGLIGIAVIGGRFSDNPGNLIFQASEMMRGRFEDDFGSSRGWIWKRGLSVIPENPVFGTGPDTFEFALGQEAQLESASRYGVKYDKAHNLFLQIAVCMGIPALLAFLIFIGSTAVSAVKRAFERPLLLAFGAASLSYTLQSFFCVEVPITTPLLWISLGVVAGEVWMDKIGYEQIEL